MLACSKLKVGFTWLVKAYLRPRYCRSLQSRAKGQPRIYEKWVDEEGCKLQNDHGSWMIKCVVDARQTHLENFKMTITQYTFGWDSRLKKLKWELASNMSKHVVLTDHLNDLLLSSEDRAN